MNFHLKSSNLFLQKLLQNDKIITSILKEKIIEIRRVTKVTKGGKQLNFRTIIVIGDEKGTVGVGVGKANDVLTAFKKAKMNGIKNLIKVPITKFLSIPFNISGYYSSSNIILHPSKEGSGIIAGGAIRIILEIAGIKNVMAKQFGSKNLLNNSRAAILALNTLNFKNIKL
jgi:small subunit ribosomal protein S5